MRDIYAELTAQLRVKAPRGASPADIRAILSDAPDGSWYRALSPDRVNALEWLPLDPDMRVLEIGADHGVYAALASRVLSYDILDTDEDHADFIKARYPASENIHMISSAASESYDLVIVSLLEGKKDPGEAAGYVRPGGLLALAADNASALKYMTGAKKAEGDCLLNHLDLSKVPLTKIREYYPLNCAMYARNIWSEERLPQAGDFGGISESFSESRYVLASDELIYGNLSEAGAFPEFAPSFIVIYSKGHSDIKEKLPVYVKYNRMRREEYALKTELFIRDGRGKAVKTALTKEANAHIEGFAKRAALLERENTDLSILRAKIGRNAEGFSYAEFPLVEGESLSEILAGQIRDGEAPEDEIEAAIRLILGPEDTESHNLDSLFDNVIMRDGEAVLIDYEWVSEEAPGRDFLRYRILRYWYESYESILSAYDSLPGFLSHFGVDPTSIPVYEERELALQDAVRGEMKETEEKFTVPQIYAGDLEAKLQKLDECTGQLALSESEIEALRVTLRKERETERLSQNHIRNIEHINEVQKEELRRLSEENEYLRRHESLGSRVKRALINRIDAFAPAGSEKRALIHITKDFLRHPIAFLCQISGGEGRTLIKGELEIGEKFRESGVLYVPQCAAGQSPLVSIVIPAYNEVGYTYACIRSVIKHTDFGETPYEIILADDVSTDATRELGRYIRGLIIRRNEVNQGFLKNCNQAARAAGGKYIFFLNNDTEVHDGWLCHMVSLAEAHDDIGLLGSKLVYPDGRLQEAGGIIWSDASGWNYGRLDDPEKAEYNYVKEVDYISGAAIMLKRELWEEIGGFDERYAPAYCEDSDLAFEIRHRGLKVVYQPLSVVTHFEGISNGTDTEGTGLKRYQRINNEKFREKWAAELMMQEINDGDPDPFTARDRSGQKPCILIIDHYVPTWDRDAGSRTTYQYIRLFLEKGFNVKFLGDNFLKTEPYTTALEQLGVEVLYGAEYEDSIFDWIEKHAAQIDCCFLNRPHIAAKYIDFIRDHTDIRCLFYGHDLHSLRLMREYMLCADTEKLREAKYWQSVELSVIDRADVVYYPSPVETEEVLGMRPGARVKTLIAYAWDEFPEVPSQELIKAKKDLIFVGGFGHPPNADAVKWFVNEVFPTVREALPGIRFLIAGSGADCELEKLHDPTNGVEFLGYVSDERLCELYLETRLTVVPLRYGAGVKGKVVEALYHHAAVVTTLVGAEGIPEAGTVMVIAPADSAAFARALIDVYTDEKRTEELICGSGAYMRRHYSTDAAWDVIKEDFL